MDATHVLYLIDLFEGRISYNEIMYDIPISQLLEMQKIKEEQLEREAKRMEKEMKIREEKSGGGKVVSNMKRQK